MKRARRVRGIQENVDVDRIAHGSLSQTFVERSVERLLVRDIDASSHRARRPMEFSGYRLAANSMSQSFRHELGYQSTKRLSLLFSNLLELLEERCVEIQRRSGHDVMMLSDRASDVNRVKTGKTKHITVVDD